MVNVVLVNVFAIKLFRHVKALDELTSLCDGLPSSLDDYAIAPSKPRNAYLA